MKRYRTKPCEIEAVQITHSTFEDPHPNPEHIPGIKYDPVTQCVYIETLEGTMRGDLGDYIVKKVEYYPVKPDIFEMKYEEI
tara:strand:+ start:342 stop:587 length:246 start_codon:yes stop_codon:yes gene_type:complete